MCKSLLITSSAFFMTLQVEKFGLYLEKEKPARSLPILEIDHALYSYSDVLPFFTFKLDVTLSSLFV